jgi:NADH-quinone oxidoreductase subunit F
MSYCLHLYPRRIRCRSTAASKAVANATARGFLGKNAFGTGAQHQYRRQSWRRCLHLWRRNRIDGITRRQDRQTRLKPPFPAIAGLYSKPTIVNNVETLTNVPRIVLKGAEWYRKNGTEKSPGTKVFSVSGHVRKPGNYEVPFGTTMRELIYDYAGGMREDRKVEIIVPEWCVSRLVDRSQHRCAQVNTQSLAAAGTMLRIRWRDYSTENRKCGGIGHQNG